MIKELISSINRLNDNLEMLFGDKLKKSSDVTLCDWLFEYLEKYRKQYQSSEYYHFSVKRIEKYCIPFFRNIKLNDVTVDMIQEFLMSFDKTNTRDKIKVVLSGAYKKAFSLDLIPKNIFESVDVRNHKIKARKPLTYSQQRMVLESIDNEMYQKIFFRMCCSGLRLSEYYSIKSSNIDFNKKVIYVDLPDNEKKHHNRLIPFIDGLVSEGENFVLGSSSATQTYFKRLFKKLNLDICIHCFRHTFISVCNDIGFNLKWIQVVAGHGDILTTLNTYTKLLESGSSPIKDYLKRLKNDLLHRGG